MINIAKMSSRQSEATRDLKKRKKQANITTMKRYIKPTIEFIEVETSPILDGSNGNLWVDNGEGGTADPDGSDQLSNEHRSDWSDIWKNM
jgi:hypothetical protein